MAKKIRFPLEMENNVQVRTLEELKEHFSLEKVLLYIYNEKLVTWLRDRYLDDIADKIIELDEGDATFNKKLCEIFDVEYDEASEIDIESAAERNRKIGLLKELGYEKEYVEVLDQIAFEQEEIYDLLDEDITTIYLCGAKFSIPLSKKGVHYIGIDNPVAVISSKEKVDFEEKEIVLESIVFDKKYQEVVLEHEKQEVKARNAFGEYVEDIFTKALMDKNDIEVSKATYNILVQELEGFTYDANDDTKNIMEYLLSTGIEEWGSDCLIDGGDIYKLRSYLSNTGLENWGIDYIENE